MTVLSELRTTGDTSAKHAESSVARAAYVPTLDGWRAVAITMVLLAHAPTLHLWRFSTNRFHAMGEFGVYLFFGISGLLISGKLLDEERSTGKLHIRNFYLRRLFRIQPAALFYLGVVVLLTVGHRLPPYFSGIVAAFFLVRNCVQHQDLNTWATGHFWSLSVEEHFYLLLPGFLMLVRRWRARLLIALALLSFGWRAFLLEQPGGGSFLTSIRTDTCLCMLLLPAGIAVLLKRSHWKTRAVRWMQPWVLIPVTLGMLPDHSPLHPLLLAVPAFLLLSTVLHPGMLVGRILESAPLRFIGHISYSLYLWQEIFLSGYYAPATRPFGWLHESVMVWGCVFTAAIASYYLIEKPCIRVGHRLIRRLDAAKGGSGAPAAAHQAQPYPATAKLRMGVEQKAL